MAYPKQFGQPCWTAEQVSKVISLTAQTSVSSAPYFLAAHSPFLRIIDDKTGCTVKEEDAFCSIFSSARDQAQVFVKGEPGTGKSHLIRWLKLRADYAAQHHEDGLDQFTFVLVSRGNGSLKDTLSQIVTQLGDRFTNHLSQVRGAIDKLSDSAARATLLLQLALEIDTHWSSRSNRSPLDPKLKHLGQMLRSNGCGRWFTRDDGVIHKVIRRLTEKSTFEEQHVLPKFTQEDFEIAEVYLQRAETSEQVRDFSEDLLEEVSRRQLSAEAMNLALKDAIRGLTGLKGSDLLQIFNEIRRELGPKKSLGVFIEDVSVTGLDQDVVNAFEPRAGDGLCRMIAVLGIVDEGWRQLPTNQRERATGVYEVGGGAATQWATDSAEVARFTARYLNAVRSEDADIDVIAKERFEGDVGRSKCKDCPHRAPCHKSFGCITLEGDVEIGMFPFNIHAPHALLNHLAERCYRSQRGLLDRVLLPALAQSRVAFDTHQFPQPGLFNVSPPPIDIWSGFTNRFCGGGEWDEEQKRRLKFVAQFWTNVRAADKLGSALAPLREALGFPPFSSAPSVSPDPIPDRPLTPQPEQADPELIKYLGLLEKWSSGEPLQNDSRFRELLSGFIGSCVAWGDQRGTPITEKKRLTDNIKFPRIDGQTTRQSASWKFFVDFERSPETRSLLEGLLLFQYRGRRSWSFEHGEMHKRNLSRWLRKHRRSVIERLQPDIRSLTNTCVRASVQMLAVASKLRDRKKSPEGRADRIERLFTDAWNKENSPTILSAELQKIANDLQVQHAQLRDFLVKELGAGQGVAEPRDFIDPLPILDVLEEFDVAPRVEITPPEVRQSYWEPRFAVVAKLEPYGDGGGTLQKERQALAAMVDQVHSFVREAGFVGENFREELIKCLEAIVEVVDLQHGTQNQKAILSVPNPPFDDLWKKKQIRDADWRASSASALASASRVLTEDDGELLVFEPVRLKGLCDTLLVVRQHLALVEKQIADEEGASGDEGDSRTKLLQELESIATHGLSTADDEESDEP